MITKICTDIDQSKKLTEILPFESADMRYGYIAPYEFSDRMYDGGYDKVPYPKDFFKLCADFCEEDIYDGSLPCWSLAALFNIIENKCSYFELVHLKTYRLSAEIDDIYGEELVDACYEMILKLHERKLL